MRLLVVLWCGVGWANVALVSTGVAAGGDQVDFNRDIRPILSNNCFKCHGFDEDARVHDLRLDVADNATAVLDSGERAIVPGNPEASDLVARVSSDDPDLRMPPPETNWRLSEKQIELLRQWIAAGAVYQKHWAYARPQRPELPPVRDGSWVGNDIDRFVLARIEAAGMKPTRAAGRRRLIRRVYFDLTGLPPAIEEVEAFVQDASPTAYERLVDRLLASPHYGERMAQNWLDAARYADTTGHGADAPRTQWLYRDWVINAFNENMPFDQFTIEQLAGDLLPGATVEQRIATGFHRQSAQALGANPRKEEFRVKGIVDRLLTTGRVWMGVTLECAECHSHKFDPITQKEYYELFAIFNNTPHLGEQFEVHGPRIDVLPSDLQERRANLRAQLARLEKLIKQESPELAARQRRWEKNPARAAAAPEHPPVGRWLAGGVLTNAATDSQTATLVGPDGKEVEAEWSSDSPWKTSLSLVFTSGRHLRVPKSSVKDVSGDMTIAAWIKTTAETADIVSKFDWRAGERSFAFGIGGESDPGDLAGRLFAWFSSEAAMFQGVEVYGSRNVNDGQWHHVAVVLKAGESAQLYIDGIHDADAQIKGQPPTSVADCDRDLAIGAGFNNSQQAGAYALEGKLFDVQLYAAALDPIDILGKLPSEIEAALAIDASQRTPQQSRQIARYYARVDPQWRELRQQIAALEAQDGAIGQNAVQAQVMEEMQTPRDTHVLVRGNFKSKGERVSPGTPRILPPLPDDAEANRLTFAKWLVADDQPLTSRVTVNRIWQHFFGFGLVRTDTNFGYQGDWPTHPELLDWLACEFVASGWDVKAIVKEIVMSATYRQDSVINLAQLAKDPENRLLARSPRLRLPAEQIRDAVLATSGLLNRRIGGPSVFPVQPEGLYEEVTLSVMGPFKISWDTSDDEDRYRRGLYVFWKRTILYPSLKTFDAPTRDVCTTRRLTTNTPMQALTSLNDPVFVEAARAFAQRVFRESPTPSFAGRLKHAFLLCLSREPTPEEVRRFRDFYDQRQQHFQQDVKAAEELLRIGTVPRDETVAAEKLAAWTLVASTILNLDEAVTKE